MSTPIRSFLLPVFYPDPRRDIRAQGLHPPSISCATINHQRIRFSRHDPTRPVHVGRQRRFATTREERPCIAHRLGDDCVSPPIEGRVYLDGVELVSRLRILPPFRLPTCTPAPHCANSKCILALTAYRAGSVLDAGRGGKSCADPRPL